RRPRRHRGRPRPDPGRRPRRRRPRRAGRGRDRRRAARGVPMRRVVLRGLATRRLRTLLSALAVVLGVALVTGALTLGGALDNGASKLATSAYDGSDAVVAAPSAFRSSEA